MGADPREQQLLADVSHLVSRIIEAAPQRAFDQRPGFRIRVNRGPRDKSLAARHIKARAFQKALQGASEPGPRDLVADFDEGCGSGASALMQCMPLPIVMLVMVPFSVRSPKRAASDDKFIYLHAS